MSDQVECLECYWSGLPCELACSDGEYEMIGEERFLHMVRNRCPDCGSTNIEDIDDEQDEDC